MKEKKSIGMVMFRLDGSVLNDDETNLIPDPEEAKRLAKELIEECRRNDRYANPDHPDYDPEFADQTAEEYQERIEQAENLENFDLNQEDQLVFLEILAYVETGPDLSIIGPISEKMQAIYSKHEETWLAMTECQRENFLAVFSQCQEEWSNYRQFHFCLEQGLSYRHILHEMKCRDIPDRSFIKPDYSLLHYLEDYEDWEAWSKRQEASLMEQNVHKTAVPGKIPSSEPVVSASSVV